MVIGGGRIGAGRVFEAIAMRKTNPTEQEDLLRRTLRSAVNLFGFTGVLNLLADEANERADSGDDNAGLIQDVLENALEEITECEECEEDDEEEREDDASEDDDEEDEEDEEA